MYDLVGKEITINAEMIMTRSAFVSATHTHTFGVGFSRLPLVFWRHCREGKAAGKACRALRRPLPWYLRPVNQGKQVMVGAGKMR